MAEDRLALEPDEFEDDDSALSGDALIDAFFADHPDMALVLGSVVDGKPQLMICLGQNRVDAGKNAGTIIRLAGKEIQGGGGGQPAYATAGGKNPDGLDNAIAAARNEIEG